ncbi:MAG: response regulator transcription factor [Gemmobacter sp.]
MVKHVMLIEDEPNIVEAIRFLLTRDGFRVSCHHGGDDALDAVRAERPDALILDVMLPGRSGIDILRELRAEPSTADLPVMMLTACGQGRDRDMAAEAGASLFMAKPFSNAEFLASLRSLLDKVAR